MFSHTRSHVHVKQTNDLSIISIINPCHNCNEQAFTLVSRSFAWWLIEMMSENEDVLQWNSFWRQKICHLVLDTANWFNLCWLTSLFHYSSMKFTFFFPPIPMLASLHILDCWHAFNHWFTPSNGMATMAAGFLLWRPEKIKTRLHTLTSAQWRWFSIII